MPRPDGGRKGRRAEPYDFSHFRGYRGPRFTPIPDEFLDHQLASLTSAEAKVMLFLFRKTYGYRKSGDHVSFAQLQHGTVAGSGQVIDRGTGLSKATIWRALKGLQKKGLIEVHRQRTRAGDPEVNYYRIREYSGPDDPDVPSRSAAPESSGPDYHGPGGDPGRPARPESVSAAPLQGSFNSETTPVLERNHPQSETEPPGSLKAKQTREHCTRDNYTLSVDLPELARAFLQSIGYHKPSRAKRERTLRVLTALMHDDGYNLDELRAACEIAASIGARGPELIPHVVGQEAEAVEEVGESFIRAHKAERERWQLLADRFASLSASERKTLIRRARASNPILAKRPPEHPLVRAAAIALLDEG